ncbi:hypothetical protein TNCV_4715081 [Trichonephila clavipes]|nr:hypothetical protein TNCV_4715081 [Trichonephila clavipes]
MSSGRQDFTKGLKNLSYLSLPRLSRAQIFASSSSYNAGRSVLERPGAAFFITLDTTRGLLVTDLVILNHDQVTRVTPVLAPLSPNYNTTPTVGRWVFSGTGPELMTRQQRVRYPLYSKKEFN